MTTLDGMNTNDTGSTDVPVLQSKKKEARQLYHRRRDDNSQNPKRGPEVPREPLSASLRRRSSLSRDGLPEAQQQHQHQQYATQSRQHHTRGTSTSTSIHYYPSSSTGQLQYPPDEHEELTVDFEDSVHLNNLNLEEDSDKYDSMGRNTAGNGNGSYSSLPTTSNGHHDYPSSSSSSSMKRRNSGRGGGDSRWNALAKWQKNAIIFTAVLVFGLILLNSGKGPAKDYVLKKTNSSGSGGTATSEEDIKIIQRPAAIAKEPQQQGNKAGIQQGTHETGVVKPGSDSLANNANTVGGAKKVPTGAACVLPPGKPEFQYALMIDAGSTGSRMHVYTFSNCLPEGTSSSASKGGEDPLPTLVDELFYPITPGLSSYRGRPRAAAESLTKLMEEAVKAVPKSERACTPIAVKATAGLRLLGAKESQEILDEVERWLKTEWPFQVVEDGVVIMDGKDEGVYAWITINYLLGLIGPGKKAGQSAAVMDLGGASTQIVFEPSFPSTSKLSPGDHVYDLNFASEDHTLYQHSHLGYGLMQARRSVHNLVAFTHLWSSATKSGSKHKQWDDFTEDDLVHSPCLVKGGRKTVLLDPPGRKAVNVTLLGTGAGFEACRRVVDVVMAKDALCEEEPCAFGGVYQPRLMETFGSGPIYALSYFYDRIVPLGLGVDGKTFTISQLRELTEDVCAGPNPSSSAYAGSSTSPNVKGWSRFKGNLEAMAELEDRPEYCLDLSFMYSLLSLGYELAPERELVTGKKINDIELGWALGAGIALLEHSSLTCRNPDA